MFTTMDGVLVNVFHKANRAPSIMRMGLFKETCKLCCCLPIWGVCELSSYKDKV